MTIAREIAPHLPFLRRFSRSLSGSQKSGDSYVIAALETLIADPSQFPRALKPRLALYQFFLRMWSSLSLDDRPQPDGLQSAELSLERLAPLSRQAFLLQTVEGFSKSEVATILNKRADQIEALIDEAARQIADQLKTDILIIEDEPIIALDIETIIEDLGHRSTGIARTHREALERVAHSPPGLILADIQLADQSSGLEAVNEILETIDIPVIFITAYPERLLTGEKPEPAFLITKPFHADAVKAAISQALFFDRKAGASSRKRLNGVDRDLAV